MAKFTSLPLCWKPPSSLGEKFSGEFSSLSLGCVPQCLSLFIQFRVQTFTIVGATLFARSGEQDGESG